MPPLSGATLVVELGRVDAGTGSAATNSRWVFQTSVDVISLSLSLLSQPHGSGSGSGAFTSVDGQYSHWMRHEVMAKVKGK